MKQTRTIVRCLHREDIHRGPLVLVNRENPIRHAAAEEQLATIAPGVWLEKQAARLYETVMQKLSAEGRIVPVSGYRSFEEQRGLFADALARHGAEYTRTYVALPGCSEHQTGLALDVAQQADSIDVITPSFPYAGICQRFREVAARHGFIQRYPKGKEYITGIGHEPWHFRYVGMPHSELMREQELTLEEYSRWVKDFPWERHPYNYTLRGRRFEIGYVPAGRQTTEIALHGEPYTVSGNNADGFIVTVWGCPA